MIKQLPEYGEALAQHLSLEGSPDPTSSMTIHPVLDMTTDIVVEDCARLLRARGEPLVSDVARRIYAAGGGDPDRVDGIPENRRVLMHNAVVRELRDELRARKSRVNLTSTLEMLLSASDDEHVIWGHQNGDTTMCLARDVRRAIGMPVEEFMHLEGAPLEKVLRRVSREVRAMRTSARETRNAQDFARARGDLHERLETWARGELRLEKSGGSSIHRLLAYDVDTTEGRFAKNFDDCQVVVVENDWGAAVPPVDGEWRTPFPFMCWEMRLSGVRVLAFTDVKDERSLMWMVYGNGEHWVCDDFSYDLGLPTLPRGISHRVLNHEDSLMDKEFRPVAARMYACIRAICIMMDAEVAAREPVRVPERLAAKRRKEGRVPLRDYYVVRLLGVERRAHEGRVRIAGSASVERSPQRGHWRKGTWVHYDDQDSGQVQYVNDGGFVVSKTWRRWHFAGDPNNIIHREYVA